MKNVSFDSVGIQRKFCICTVYVCVYVCVIRAMFFYGSRKLHPSVHTSLMFVLSDMNKLHVYKNLFFKLLANQIS